MTEERMALAELLQKSGDGDFLRSVAEAVLQILMEADVEGLIGASRHERTGDRLNYRNGYRERGFDTRLGSLSLRIHSTEKAQGAGLDHFGPRRRSTDSFISSYADVDSESDRKRGGPIFR
jgi:putative transposase